MRRIAVALAAGLLLLALIGYADHDHHPALAGLTYLPLFPIALGALLLVLWPARGRALRYGLGGAGILGVALGASSVLAWHESALGAAPDDSLVRLLQWNVWSGSPRPFLLWPRATEIISGSRPDIIALSEAPGQRAMRFLMWRLGDDWSAIEVHSAPGAAYVYHLVLASRWPVRQLPEPAIPNGKLLLGEVAAPSGPLRVMIVDGESSPWHDRLPTLRAVSEFTRAESERGAAIDVLAGDFNVPTRSAALEPLWGQGYRDAARAAIGWRATWPALLPLIEIDHVLVRPPLGFDCRFFTSVSSDHRGQLVRLRMPTKTMTAGADAPSAQR